MVPSADRVIGETIGSYRVLAQIGAGGMGAVYLAEHRLLGRKAAVKVLRAELSHRPDLLERFFAEARAASLVEHPGIVEILDCEVDAAGRPFIVMEHLTGETLAETLRRRGSLPLPEAVLVTRLAAEALAAAHARGIVHRDVKPDNVFLLAAAEPAVKIVDFGIAKLADDLALGTTRTQTGVVMGTPLYMSPEQCRGAGTVDHRTDIYSLGCILFELCAGRPPFCHEGAGELVAAHLTEAPPALRTLCPAVPPELDALVARLLAKRPDERPATMSDVAAALSPLEHAPPPRAAGPKDEYAPAPPRRVSTGAPTTLDASAAALDRDELRPARRSAAPLVALGTVALAGIAAVTLWGGGGPTERRQAVPPMADAAPRAATAGPSPVSAAVPVGDADAAPRELAPPRQRPRPVPRPRVVAAAHASRATLDSEPPGAEVCAARDRRFLGRTSTTLTLEPGVRRGVFFLYLPGHRVERVVLTPGATPTLVRLQPLGPDDLEAASPCRR